MKRLSLAVAAFVVVWMAAASAAAQSLADLAKQEEARRKAIKTPSKVITEADIRKYGPATPPTEPADQAVPAATGQAAKPDDPAAKAKEGEQDQPQKDEAWWRNRITEARDKLDRLKFSYDAMQTHINSLTTDIANIDDPAQRTVAMNNRVKALGELQRLKDQMDEQTKAIADIEEEARVAGVPPGWLR